VKYLPYVNSLAPVGPFMRDTALYPWDFHKDSLNLDCWFQDGCLRTIDY
jgi:hypothetical protein